MLFSASGDCIRLLSLDQDFNTVEFHHDIDVVQTV